ncbi:CENP-B N-terminal DNA-binding domain [Popillia japonica]|uniref:CENP-B N-terminal DNA-binding domain n=1 Tax=Popillia japonica TaxID=7064 RepID=A0AAW1HV50_POPJA
MKWDMQICVPTASQVKGGHITLREARDMFGIPKSTLSKFIKKKHLKSYGGQSALSGKEESSLVEVNYTKENLKVAASQVKGGHITLREARDMFGIPKSTLSKFIKKKHLKSYGGQSALSGKEESSLVEVLILAAEWGFPLKKFDIRKMAKSYLERLGRHTDRLTVRLSESIKRGRAEANDKVINEYVDNLSITLENVPAENVINYDETNFVDDPGRPRDIVRRQTKHPERIVGSSKSAVSIMFSATGDGTLLPPLIVYKSEHLYVSRKKHCYASNVTLEKNEPQEEHVEDEVFVQHVGDEYLEEHVQNDQDENETLQENYELDQDENEISIFPEDFVELCFKNEKVKKYYIGKITSVVEKTKFTATFLTPNRKLRNTFIFPPVQDSSEIALSQIVKKATSTCMPTTRYFYN